MRANRIIFLIVAIVPLTYLSGNWTVPPLGDPLFIKSAAGEIYASALLLLYLLSQKTSEIFRIKKNLTVYVATIFFVYISLSAFWSQNFGFFVDAWLKWFAAAVTFSFAILIARTPAFVPAVIDIMVISAVMVAGIGLAQHYLDWNYLHQTAPPGSTFSNRNLAGHVIVICLPLAFFRLLLPGSSIYEKFISIVSILVLGLYGYHTMATAVRVSIAAEAGLLSCFLIWLYLHKYRSLGRDVSVVVSLSALVVSIFLIPLGDAGTLFETIINKVNDSYSSFFGSRLDVWHAAWSIFREHPIIGIGLGNFFEVWSRGYIEHSNLLGLQRVHNDPLEIAADLGFIGLSLLILLYILISKSGLRLLVHSDQPMRIISVLILCSLAGFGVNSLFSFPLQLIAPLVSVALLSGLLVGSDLHSWRQPLAKGLKKNVLPKITAVSAATALLIANIYVNFHWLKDIHGLSAKLTLVGKSTLWQPGSNLISPNIINPLRMIVRIYLEYNFFQQANSLVSTLMSIWPDEPFNLILAIETNLSLGKLATAEKMALKLIDQQPRNSLSAEHYLLTIYSKRNEISNIQEIYSKLRELKKKEYEAEHRNVLKTHFLSILFQDQNITKTMFQLHEDKFSPHFIVDANMAVFYANNHEPEKAYTLAKRSLTYSDYFRETYAFRMILSKKLPKERLKPFRRKSLEQLKKEPALGLLTPYQS